MKKRTLALLFLALVLAVVAGTLAALRTPWAAKRLCALAAGRVERATGLPLEIASCRIRPLALEVEIRGARLGSADRPVFEAELLEARLAPVQVLGRQVRLESLRVVRPRLAFAASRNEGGGGPAKACPPEALSRFVVRQLDVEGGALDVSFPDGSRVVAHRFDVRSRPPPRSLRALASAEGHARVDVTASPVRVETGGRVFVGSALSAGAELALDLSYAEIAHAGVELGGISFAARGTIHDLCLPRLDLVATAKGRLPDALALAGRPADAEGRLAVTARVSGTARAPDVAATVEWADARVRHFRPGQGRAELRLAEGALDVARLELAFDGGAAVARGRVKLERGLPVSAELETTGVDLAEVLDRLGVRDPWITVRLDAKAKVAGTLSPPLLTGQLATDVRDLKALTRSFREGRVADPGVIAFKRGRLEGAVRVDADGLYLDGSRLAVGRGTVVADAAVHFANARGFWVRGRGEADLDVLGRVGEVPWAGLASFEANVAAAPYGNPRITAKTRIPRFRFLDVELGDASADLVYEDFLLRISGAEGLRSVSRWRGEGVVDLGRYPPHVVSSRFEAKGRLRDLFDAVRDFLPRTRAAREVLDGDVEVSGTATGPADALDAEWAATLGAGMAYGRSFESGRAEGRIHRGIEVRYDRAELRRGPAVVRFSGTWGSLPPYPWSLDVSAAGLPLAELALPGGSWSGSVAGTARVEGSEERPRVRFAASGDSVHVRGLALGTVQVGGSLAEDKLVVTGGADGMWFEGEASLEGRMPFRARAGIAHQDVTRLLPHAPPPGFRARVAGEATAEGELVDVAQARARLRLDEVEAGYADFRVRSAGPSIVEVNRGRVDVQGLVLRGANTELALSGSRAASGELDLSATGALDLRLLSGLAPILRRPSGRLTLEAHVGGTAEEPVLVGSGRLQEAGFELKGTSMIFAGLRGELAFSQNRILFDRLEASVNGGRAKLAGEVELASFAPSRLRVEGELDEVPVAVPAHFPATLSGRIEANGTPEATTISGRIHVVRARYTADVNLEGGLLELKRRPAPPPRAYDRAGEWLRFDLQIVADGDVRVENDLVRGALRGELTLTGSLAAPGMVGSLSMIEGSRAIFRGNEFLLSHGVLDFTDRHAVAIALDVHGESEVRDYQIFMHVFGSLDAPELTLTSAPPLSQPDIITLLSLGFTRRDAGAGAGLGSVATAAAAQALFTASGLDEQVKRFLPRSGLMRDFSVRITSAYSEGTGQVEPRAEFESWLLRDRLRLRYQAPLAGARGQKAQAELRLGDHSAVQYQWDNDNPDVATGDHGVDLKLRWEWTDR